MTPAHDFIAVGDGIYRVEVPDLGIVLHVDRLRREHGDLVGELTVTCNLAGARRLTDEDIISAGNLNLSSIRARQDRATHLAKRSQLNTERFDWYGSVEYLCLRVIQAERTGQPAVLLRDAPKPSPDDTWLVHGGPILRRHPMIYFGDGGTLKSYLALATAGELARRGVPVLYADWETDEGDHRERLEALYGEDMPPVHYARCEWPLVQEADRLRRLILTHGIEYLICDSAAYGCDGPPEAAETANRYFRALRQLRVGSLLLAHVTKSEDGDKRPFGSVFWHNSARATWYLKRSEADGNAGEVTLALWNRKTNKGPLLPVRGLRITFGSRLSIETTDLAEHDDFAARLPLWQRMQYALKHGPMTAEELAQEIGGKVDSIDRIARRSKTLFVRIPGSSGTSRIALLERKAS